MRGCSNSRPSRPIRPALPRKSKAFSNSIAAFSRIASDRKKASRRLAAGPRSRACELQRKAAGRGSAPKDRRSGPLMRARRALRSAQNRLETGAPRRLKPLAHGGLAGKSAARRQGPALTLDNQDRLAERPRREGKFEGAAELLQPESDRLAVMAGGLQVERRFQVAAKRKRQGVGEGEQRRFLVQRLVTQPELAGPNSFKGRLGGQVIVHRRRVRSVAAARVAPVDQAAMA